MIWIGMVLAALVLAVTAAVALYFTTLQGPEGPRRLGWLGAAVPLAAFGLFFVLFTLFCSVKQVPAGHRGLVYEFGNITAVEQPGLTVIPPWAGMKNANVQVQAYRVDLSCYPDQQAEMTGCIAAASNIGQNVYLQPVLNFSIADCEGTEARRCTVDNERIIELYKNVGPNYIQKVIEPRFKEVPKAVTAGVLRGLTDDAGNPILGYSAEEILNLRQNVAADIEVALREAMKDDPRFAAIQIISFRLENVDFDKGFNDRLRANSEAAQQIEIERNNVRVKEQVALQVQAEAEGQKQAVITKAEGEAEANRLISESLSPEILQRLAIEKIAGNLQVALLPADGSFLLDPTRLLQPTVEPAP